MKTRITITIDPELYNQIKELAQAENRSVSNMVEQMLKQAVDNVQRIGGQK